MDNTIEVTNVSKRPGKISSFFFCLGVIIAFLILQAIVSGIIMLPKLLQQVIETGGAGDDYMTRFTELATSDPIVIVAQFAAEIVCIVAALIWYIFGYVKKEKKEPGYRSFRDNFHGFKDIAFILTGCLATWGLAATIQQILAILMPQTTQDVGNMLTSLLGSYQVLGALTAIILAPIMEELVVRGIIIHHAKRAYGLAGSIIICAIMFGLFHMNIIQGLYVIPMGLFWGFVSYKYNSVIPCILCHMLNNFIGMLLGYFMPPVLVFIVFGALAAFIGIKAGIIDLKEKKEKENE